MNYSKFLLSTFGAVIALTSTSPIRANAQSFGYNHKNCELSEGAHVVSPIDLETGKVIPECAPEVLYSWHSKEDIQTMLSSVTKKNFFPYDSIDKRVWAWRTPMGTFGYGDYLIRMKLKPNVKYYWNKVWDKTGGCQYLKKGEEKYTIILGYYVGGENYSEYVICSPDVVESWSWGTQEIYDEMKNEINWTESHYQDFTQFDRFYKTLGYDTDYDSGTYFKFHIDGKDWSASALQEKFNNILALQKKSNAGNVFYSPGVRPDRRAHFLVRYPDYFNLGSLGTSVPAPKPAPAPIQIPAHEQPAPSHEPSSPGSNISVRAGQWFNSLIIVDQKNGKSCVFEYGSSMNGPGSISRNDVGLMNVTSGSAYAGWGKIWITQSSNPVDGSGPQLKVMGVVGPSKYTQSNLKIDPASISSYIDQNYTDGKSVGELCWE